MAGLTLKLVHFLIYLPDCGNKPVWGIQNKAAQLAWKTSIEAEREERYNALLTNFGNENNALMMDLGGS